jgi:hypothetical protein
MLDDARFHMNLSEVNHGNQAGQKRADLLEQILQISTNVDESLKNQTQMLSHDDASLKNQSDIP